MSDIALGLELMKYGLLGTFSVIVLFYLMITILMKIFPYRNEENDN
ncbi:MAG: hypothetical protein GX213_09500 [Clostridiaceae bacterium]|nr:hypothetical protein [Clostridiaceae bacterium]